MTPSPLSILHDVTPQSPFSDRVFLVGGAVRDEVMGRPPQTDWDFVVLGSAAEFADWLWQEGISSIPPVTYPQFGTAMVQIGGLQAEFVTARREQYQTGSRKPEVEAANLLEDAERRDFTCNTLLRDVGSGSLIDPLGLGLSDIAAKILRTPGDPDRTLAEDPLRMLRAVRFRWQLGFAFAPGLETSLRRQSSQIVHISDERIRDEVLKMLRLERPDECFNDLHELGLLRHFGPELEDMIGVMQGSYHHLDVWDHSMLVMRLTDADDLILRLAALFHDIGKSSTRGIDKDGRVRFFGHEIVGSEMARDILRRWRLSQDTIDDVCLLIRHHMRLGSMPQFTDIAARRLLRDLGDLTWKLLDLCAADANGLKKEIPRLDTTGIRDVLLKVSARTPPVTLVSPLSGDEVMAATGLAPGREVGRWMSLLTDKVIEGTLIPGDKEKAVLVLKEMVAQRDADFEG